MVSEERSGSFGSRLARKKRCLNRMFSRLFRRIICRETFEKRRRKGYSIVSNSTLFEVDVIFNPWTKRVMNLNLRIQCLLWLQIAKNKKLGLLQPLEARELGESFADLMATPAGVQWIFHDNAASSDSYPVFPIYLEAGIARRTRGTERGKHDRSKSERWWEGGKQSSSFPTPLALLLLTALSR